MKKKEVKKTLESTEQQAQPLSSEQIAEEKNIPASEQNSEGQEDAKEIAADEAAKSEAQERPENVHGQEGEKDTDTPEKTNNVFDGTDWKKRVEKFFTDYPLAKRFVAQIGKEIADDISLHTDGQCLEKALLRVLCREYVAPEQLAGDETFLQSYVLTNDAVKQAIVDEYLDNLQKSAPVRAITSGGQITLAPPSRPKSIEEAGAVIRTMLNNRRI